MGYMLPASSPTMLRKILGTPELRRLLATAIPDILDLWAGNRAFRKAVARQIARHLQKSILYPGGPPEPDIASLLADPAFVSDLFAAVSPILSEVVRSAASVASAIEELPAGQLEKLAKGLFDTGAPAWAGRLLTSILKISIRLHEQDELFFSRICSPAIKSFIEEMDFGELRQAADMSRKDAAALFEAIIDSMFEQPAKMILLLSFIPDIATACITGISILLERLNTLPPDVLCDVVVSFSNEIDPAALGRLINEAMELLRKIHTGSALIGEAGTPLLSVTMHDFIEKLIAETDPELLCKAASAMQDIKLFLGEALASAISAEPEMLAALTEAKIKGFSRRMQIKARRLDTLQDLAGDEFDALAGRIAGAADLKDAAEAINAFARNFVDIWDARPDECKRIVREAVEAIDEAALLEAAGRIIDAAGPMVREKLAEAAPDITRWLSGLANQGTGQGEQGAWPNTNIHEKS